MTEEELEYGVFPQQESIIPDGMRVCIFDLNEPKKVCIAYKDGVLVFKARSKSDSYIVRRLKKFINDINKEEK